MEHAELDGVTFPMKRDDGSLVTVHVTTDALDKLGGRVTTLPSVKRTERTWKGLPYRRMTANHPQSRSI